jgi:hypothetical protein
METAMRTPILAFLILAALPLSACVSDGNSGRYGYDRPGRTSYDGRPIRDDDYIYRGNDGRYYCKRDDGTTGTIVGAIAGGVLGNVIAPGGSKTLGTILGAGGGALAGRAIDKNNVRCK